MSHFLPPCFIACLFACSIVYSLAWLPTGFVSCLRVYVLAKLFGCLPPCLIAWLVVYLFTCLLACLVACLLACLVACLLACLLACFLPFLLCNLLWSLVVFLTLYFCNYLFQLLICGLGKIDLNDWKRHTKLKHCTAEHTVIRWFWEVGLLF